MKWLIITCDNSRHIVPVQKHLFKKYVAWADVEYIDLKDEPVATWTTNVLNKIHANSNYVVFGLDDFLPIDYFQIPTVPVIHFNRLEMGWGGSRKGIKHGGYNLFTKDQQYRISCQFSIWNINDLKIALQQPRNPWQFEVQGTLPGNVLSVLNNPWRYIEESAISKRRPGMINLCGMRKHDIQELVDLGLIDRTKIIYGWKGNSNRTKESYGKKYAQYY